MINLAGTIIYFLFAKAEIQPWALIEASEEGEDTKDKVDEKESNKDHRF